MSCLMCQSPRCQSKSQTCWGTVRASAAVADRTAGASSEALASAATIARRVVGRLIMCGFTPAMDRAGGRGRAGLPQAYGAGSR